MSSERYSRSALFTDVFGRSLAYYLSIWSPEAPDSSLSIETILSCAGNTLESNLVVLARRTERSGLVHLHPILTIYREDIGDAYRRMSKRAIKKLPLKAAPIYVPLITDKEHPLTSVGITRFLVTDLFEARQDDSGGRFEAKITRSCLILGWTKSFEGPEEKEYETYSSIMTRWISIATSALLDNRWHRNKRTEELVREWGRARTGSSFEQLRSATKQALGKISKGQEFSLISDYADATLAMIINPVRHK